MKTKTCSNCGAPVPTSTKLCEICGSLLQHNGNRLDNRTLFGFENYDFLEDIIQRERILGQFSPSRIFYKPQLRIFTQTTGISLLTGAILSTFSYINFASLTFHVLELFLITIGVYFSIFLLTIALYSITLKKRFSAKYILTDSSAIKMITRKKIISMPFEGMGDPLILKISLRNPIEYSVYFPEEKHSENHESMSGNKTFVSQIYRMRNSPVANSGNRTTRVTLKLRHNVKKDFKKRSFRYLSQDDAMEIAKLVKNKITKSLH